MFARSRSCGKNSKRRQGERKETERESEGKRRKIITGRKIVAEESVFGLLWFRSVRLFPPFEVSPAVLAAACLRNIISIFLMTETKRNETTSRGII